MTHNAFLKEPCYKITVMGNAEVGKTSVINRLVNKCFIPIYKPTTDIETYSCRLNLNDDSCSQKTFVNVIIQDTFGLDNPILNMPVQLMTSPLIKQKREKMSSQFTSLMLTSNERRDQLSKNEKAAKTKFNKKKAVNYKDEIFMESIGIESEHISRVGFVFVCEIKNEGSIKSVIKIIEKLHEIEKSNNLICTKMIMFNKTDIIEENEFNETIVKFPELKEFITKYKIDISKVSALTGRGISDSFINFLNKIHQEQRNQQQNDGINEPDDIAHEYDHIGCIDNMNSMSKKIFCGRSLFTCGEHSEEDDDDE